MGDRQRAGCYLLMAITSRQIGAQVIKVLGLPECKVTSIKLEMHADDAVRIEVEMLPTEQEAIGVFDVIKRYELVEREESAAERCLSKFCNTMSFRGQPDIPGWRERIDLNVAAAKSRIAAMAERALGPKVGFTTTQVMSNALARNYR